MNHNVYKDDQNNKSIAFVLQKTLPQPLTALFGQDHFASGRIHTYRDANKHLTQI